MKLSEILGWPEKKITNTATHILQDADESYGFNTALTSCDREIDKEALDSALSQAKNVEDFISTMPTWLKRIEK